MHSIMTDTQQNQRKPHNPLWVFTGLTALAAATLGGLYYVAGPQLPGGLASLGQPAADKPADTAPSTPDSATAPAAVTPENPAALPDPAIPTFDTVRVEPNGDTVVAGRALPGAAVTLKLNGDSVGTATADATGAFVIIPGQPLKPGAGTLTLEVAQDGKVTPSQQTVAVAVKPNAEGAAMVAVIDPAKPNTTVVAAASGPAATPAPAAAPPTPAAPAAPAGDGKTVTLNAVDYDQQGNIVFSGRGTPGNTVRLYVDNAPAGETAVGPDGAWTVPGGNAVSPGTHSLRTDELASDGSVISRVELPFLREDPARLAAATPPAGAEAAAADRIVIQPGNNLWRLSRKIYGKGIKYTVIYEANKDQIRNPRLIYPGQIFLTPRAE